jgi:predicted RNA-binding protein YlqC (UPF0109 family)
MDSESTARNEEPTEPDTESELPDDELVDEPVDSEPGNLESDDEPLVDAVRPDESAVTADLEELVRYVAAKLVQNSEEITVESELRAGTVYVSLRVPEEEMGRVIGREGRTAKAIRTLVSIAGSRHNVHARLDIDG